MNRGIARRTMFETDEDRRMFLSLVARQVRAGRLELHAYSLRMTHFHLEVRSPCGKLADAMQRIQTGYSRWFNRTRRRDGPLVRGRFRSKLIDDLSYRCTVVSYIHDNAVAAGEVARPEDDPWSSAWHWHRRGEQRPPRWLSMDWIQSELDARGAESLEEVFPSRVEPEFRAWVERQLHRRLPEEREDATIHHVAEPRTVRWAIRKAKLADGTRPFRPISPTRIVELAIVRWMRKIGPLLGLIRRSRRDAWVNLRAGLLRALSGCTQREIGLRIRRHTSTICRDLQEHRALLRSVPDYEALHAAVTSAVLETVRRSARVAIS
jgi:hypothetical protein